MDFFYELIGIAADNGVWSDILGNDCTSRDYGIFTHGDAWQDGGSSTNPSILADMDGLT